MGLTPEDIRNKQFTTVRFKEGYELEEVDNFLDEIEGSMTELVKANADLAATSRGEIPQSIKDDQARLEADNSELAKKVTELQAALESAQTAVALSHEGSNDVVDLSDDLAAVQSALVAAQAENAQLKDELAAAHSQADANVIAAPVASGDASQSSLRVLELAQRTADEAVAAARMEAETLRSEVTAEVAALRADAKSEAASLVADANNTVATITREFETQRAGLERRVEELVTYEREYRSRLRIYLEGQLRELDSKSLAGDREITEE